MNDSVAPKNMEHLFYMAGDAGAWQHYNYYLEHYTKLPLLKSRDDVNNVSSVYCMVNKGRIVKRLAVDLFSIDLDSEKCEITR